MAYTRVAVRRLPASTSSRSDSSSSGVSFWSIAELSPEAVRALLRSVVSFEIEISRIEGKFKLDQGETPDRNEAAIAQLEQHGAGALAGYIRRYNDL